MTTTNPANSQLIAQFPYACVEIGGGMMSSYGKRIKIVPDNVAALALSNLCSGNNMPGYYMFQGGINPDGKLSFFNETHPNQMPLKDYDFQAPLGAAGQVRAQYHLLRQQHLFLQDLGTALARMPAYFPDQKPASLHDFDTLRWGVRTNGRAGSLFFNNQQPYEPLPAHRDVQFAIKMNAGTLLMPRQPVTIPTSSYGIWPFLLDCDGVTLTYATAQPLCRIATRQGAVYFFTALEGIPPELMLHARQNSVQFIGGESEALADGLRVFHIRAGTSIAARHTCQQKRDFLCCSHARAGAAVLAAAVCRTRPRRSFPGDGYR